MEVARYETSFRFNIPSLSAPSSPIPSPEHPLFYFHFPSAPPSPHYTDDETRIGGSGGGEDDMFDEFTFHIGRKQEFAAADMLFEKGRIRAVETRMPPFSSRCWRRKSRLQSEPNEEKFLIKNMSSSQPQNAVEPRTELALISASKRWKLLKNLFLFRCASKGRVGDGGTKEPLPKLTLFSLNKKKRGADKKSQGRITAAGGDGGDRCVRSGGGGIVVSVHEMLYREYKAAAEDKRRKTLLPYQGKGIYTCF